MAGNQLGPRSYYLYTDDIGTNYSILTDDDLATAAGLVLNDDNPQLPRRFKPRVVHMEAANNSRKALVCQRTSSIYASNASQPVTIDTVEYKSTGRRGERASFGANP